MSPEQKIQEKKDRRDRAMTASLAAKDRNPDLADEYAYQALMTHKEICDLENELQKAS
jgi:hypothetical protein